MSAPKGIRLYLRPARKDRNAVWCIRDGGREKSTGCSASEIEKANLALAEYINDQRNPDLISKSDPSKIPIADILSNYLDQRVEQRTRPQEGRARIERLASFFGEGMLSSLNRKSCRDYVSQRGSQQSARRELEDLRAAINLFFADEVVQPKIRIELPDKAPPRERWLTEKEAVKLLLTAWRKKAPIPNGAERYVARHVARFILVGIYTGTRASRICAAALKPIEGRGYVDLEQGTFYRKAPGSKETKKRQPPIRLPEKLLSHIRRWERLGLCKTCIVEWNGSPVLRVSKAFRAVAKLAGLPDVTPHTLRHTAITWALQRGAKTFDVAEFFGVSEEVIGRTYGHHNPEHHKEITTRLDRRRK